MTSRDGTLMTRAFRDGVENKRRIRAPVRIRTWNPIKDLRGLKSRTTVTGNQMGPLVDVPAMIRIEDEHWVFERIEDGILKNLTHRLIVHDSEGETDSWRYSRPKDSNASCSTHGGKRKQDYYDQATLITNQNRFQIALTTPWFTR